MIYYTADLHLGHENVIMFDNRPFPTIEQMDETIIANWQAQVREKDDVYILGDIAYRSATRISEYLDKLPGRKHLVIGNHDGRTLKDPNLREYYFDSVEQIQTITDGGRRVVLCHYPLAEWPGMFRDAIHLYAHIHNKKAETYKLMRQRENAYNAGCMINNYVPCTLDEVIRNNKAFWELDQT
ncbi:MAG: metallophosphoesterase [Oscillospiraceae bacterium]|nr:metallophosphoesterase [Oscillospiraceae bacterium]